MADNVYEIRELPWDTDYFKIKMGEVDLFGLDNQSFVSEQKWRRTLELARSQGYCFLLCQLDTGQHQTLNKILGTGAIIGDILLTYVFNLKLHSNVEQIRKYTVVQAEAIDLPQILEISGQSFTHSRFLQDPNFDQDKIARFYPKWFGESFNTTDKFLVAKNNNEVLGFISYKLQPDTETLIICFLATKESARGRGVGQALINQVTGIANKEQLTRIQVGTQLSNYPAIRLYERNGFRLNIAKYRCHVWL